jgi:ketol-acid reductoisomerase
MGEILDEIRSGRFSQEWSQQQEQAGALFEKVKKVRESLPHTQWEDNARAAFGIGDAARDPQSWPKR